MESFGEALLKLKEIYEQEVGGWQEKVLELTSQKNGDAKRIEELFARNQQLREQQRVLCENVKQLENRLRAGLCDRCTVTQEMAKRRQQQFDLCRLQSLQHISTLNTELATLRRENKRLCGDLQSLRASVRTVNGYSVESASQEVKRGQPAVVAPMSSLSPAGGSVQTAEAGHGGLGSSEEARHMDAVSQQQSFPSSPSLSMVWRTVQKIAQDQASTERRVRRTDIPDDSSPLFPKSMLMLKTKPNTSSSPTSNTTSSSSSPTVPEEKGTSSSMKVHTPIPYRPRPMKTQSMPTQPWQLADNSDWVTMSVMAEDGTVVHHNPSMLAVHPMPNNVSAAADLRQGAQEKPAGAIQRPWSGSAPVPTRGQGSPPQKGPPDQGEAVQSIVEGPIVLDCDEEDWKESIADSCMPASDMSAISDAPLDLSGHNKANKAPQQATVKPMPTGSPCSSSSSSSSSASSSSSSSPPTPSSSSSIGSQTEQRMEEVTCQDDADKGTQTAGKSETGKASDTTTGGTETSKVPSLTISLRPVVVLENMRSKGRSGQRSSKSWAVVSEEEEEAEEEEEREEKEANPRKRMRHAKEPDANGAPQAPRLTERRTRMGGRPKERSLVDTEQG
ncbi:RBBP8 N-terminal-like protein [Engraulis encrasicolus]|uniref:RBBP8 N-terminal-like protein n=1 Tax=Engraulis encrasicolus TaxID=184585 RepID=UPI002FCF0D42